MKKANFKRDLTEEIDLLDTMLTSPVELLEEMGILTQNEREKRIKERHQDLIIVGLLRT